ncbi:MAG: xanthine dehydrogenase accessory protein XdhC [Deltaproteobacteria bacterium CG2_30_63_29]|nr:MAG: xanthine dehydrogenase accessory protein XdhC [Deltaproteobacteria bacterium CG2_30_63_29]PJB34719.1 MAG: xanthine dehydrogenase accessory protein XdhC [Deltaproteobacteria bacterium CG_4_9_14_3_um_filter_63_12]
MAKRNDVFEALVDLRRRKIPCVLCTVVESKGSSPLKVGAKMVVCEDSCAYGTIGGGAVEHVVQQQARQALADGSGAKLVTHHLTKDLGMCCGGTMSVFMELQVAAPTLYVFGAGHVSMPLCAFATSAGFETCVVDERSDWANSERFPTVASLRCESAVALLEALELPADAYVVVLTHDHALDYELLKAVVGKPLAYLGVIGSQRKGARFRQRLVAEGFDESVAERFQTPMGVDIGAVTAEEIAVSIVAELVRVRRSRESK